MNQKSSSLDISTPTRLSSQTTLTPLTPVVSLEFEVFDLPGISQDVLDEFVPDSNNLPADDELTSTKLNTNPFSKIQQKSSSKSKKKKYQCMICQKSFAQSNELKFHTRTHTGEKLYECEICEKSFANSANLKSHNRSHHTGKRKTLSLS